MHDGKLMDLLAEALAQHGFTCTRNAALEGRTGTIYTVPLLAEDDDRAVILDAVLDGEVSEGAIEDLADVREDSGADVAVLCHLEPTHLAGPAHLALWDKQALAMLVGEAQIQAATGHAAAQPSFVTTPPMEPLAETLDELLPPAFQESPGIPIDDPFDLGALENLDAAEEEPEPAAEEAPLFDLGALGTLDMDESQADPADDPMPETNPFTYPLLPIRITPDEARLVVKDRIYAADAIIMVLQPVHLLDYECDLLVEGSLRYDTIQGRILVNGTDKRVVEVDSEAVDPDGFTKGVPDVPDHERKLRVSAERARELGTAFLTEAHTRLVDIEAQDDEMNFSYTEKKKVAPRPDHIRLNPLGTFHRVLWRITGPNGHVDVDALTGIQAEEVLRSPDPDIMIVD